MPTPAGNLPLGSVVDNGEHTLVVLSDRDGNRSWFGARNDQKRAGILRVDDTAVQVFLDSGAKVLRVAPSANSDRHLVLESADRDSRVLLACGSGFVPRDSIHTVVLARSATCPACIAVNEARAVLIEAGMES